MHHDLPKYSLLLNLMLLRVYHGKEEADKKLKLEKNLEPTKETIANLDLKKVSKYMKFSAAS